MITNLLGTPESDQILAYLSSLKKYPNQPQFIKIGNSLTKCHPYKPNRPIKLDRTIIDLLRWRSQNIHSLRWIAEHSSSGTVEYNLMLADLFRFRIDAIDSLLDSYGYEIL